MWKKREENEKNCFESSKKIILLDAVCWSLGMRLKRRNQRIFEIEVKLKRNGEGLTLTRESIFKFPHENKHFKLHKYKKAWK